MTDSTDQITVSLSGVTAKKVINALEYRAGNVENTDEETVGFEAAAEMFRIALRSPSQPTPEEVTEGARSGGVGQDDPFVWDESLSFWENAARHSQWKASRYGKDLFADPADEKSVIQPTLEEGPRCGGSGEFPAIDDTLAANNETESCPGCPDCTPEPEEDDGGCVKCGNRGEIERDVPHEGTEEDDWIPCPGCVPKISQLERETGIKPHQAPKTRIQLLVERLQFEIDRADKHEAEVAQREPQGDVEGDGGLQAPWPVRLAAVRDARDRFRRERDSRLTKEAVREKLFSRPVIEVAAKEQWKLSTPTSDHDVSPKKPHGGWDAAGNGAKFLYEGNAIRVLRAAFDAAFGEEGPSLSYVIYVCPICGEHIEPKDNTCSMLHDGHETSGEPITVYTRQEIIDLLRSDASFRVVLGVLDDGGSTHERARRRTRRVLDALADHLLKEDSDATD